MNPGDCTRGQLILIGALLVAVTIVSSVVLLNTIYATPDIYAQQESVSVAETERTAREVRSGLERVFLVNTSQREVNESLPYARKDSFDEIVDEYERRYVTLSTTDSAGVARIELVDNRTGGIARQNTTITGYQPYPDATVVQGAGEITRLRLFVNDTSASPFSVVISEATGPSSVQLNVDDDGVTGAVTCDLSGENFDAIEIDFVKRVGEVSTDQTYCGDLELGTSLSPPLDVEFVDGNRGRGTYTITAVNPASGNDFPSVDYRWFRNSGPSTEYVVNPVFRVEYRNPNISYNSTFALYNATR